MDKILDCEGRAAEGADEDAIVATEFSDDAGSIQLEGWRREEKERVAEQEA
jgi:hypothetical protein